MRISDFGGSSFLDSNKDKKGSWELHFDAMQRALYEFAA